MIGKSKDVAINVGEGALRRQFSRADDAGLKKAARREVAPAPVTAA
jgi:hypothetical protein